MPAPRSAKSRRRKAREPFLKRIRSPHLSLPALNWRVAALVAGVLLAAFSLISLLAPGSGALTRGWGTFLLQLLGWAAYLLPPALAAGLYWLGVRERRLDPQRVTAAVILLLVALAVTHLANRLPDPFDSSEAGYGGGWFGWLLASALDYAFGRLGAFIFAMVLAMAGATLLFNVAPSQAWDRGQVVVARGLAAWRSRASAHEPRPRRRLRRSHSDTLPESDYGLIDAEPVSASVPLKSRPEPPAVIPVVQAAGPSAGRSTRAARESRPTLEPVALASESDWTLPDPAAIFEPETKVDVSDEVVRQRADLIEQTMLSLGVPAQVVEVQKGPAITRYGVQPGYLERRSADGKIRHMRVRVNKIMALENDLALALSASRVRIPGPVPGRDVIGVEVPNPEVQVVSLGGVITSPEFQRMTSPLALALGRDIAGRPLTADLARMPHLLMAGATGSGKSVAVNAIISCLLCRNTPDMLRLVLIDPKKVELATYKGVPHLIGDVVSEREEAVGAIKWAGREMDRRYAAFNSAGVRDLRGYNERMRRDGDRTLPAIVLIVDELADLMMHAGFDVEPALCRVAQMSRATGIHLIIATQRPSVDVVTGLIKANFPCRIAFAVASQIDSRVILDAVGADRLLGRGDLLFASPDSHRAVRAQGSWISDREINRLVAYWKRTGADFARDDHFVQGKLWSAGGEVDDEGADDNLDKAIEVVMQEKRASTTLLQRHLRVGYNRASRLMDTLIARGVVSNEVDGPYGSHSLVMATEPLAEGELESNPKEAS